MKIRNVLLFCVVSLLLGSRPSNPIARLTEHEEQLNGTYTFVSATTELTEPSIGKSERMTPEWQGLWQFQNGYYSSLVVKQGREASLASRASSSPTVFAYAGTYELEGASLVLHRKYAISPLDVGRLQRISFSLQGDTLTLRESLQPYVEDIRKGVETTILKRIR